MGACTSGAGLNLLLTGLFERIRRQAFGKMINLFLGCFSCIPPGLQLDIPFMGYIITVIQIVGNIFHSLHLLGRVQTIQELLIGKIFTRMRFFELWKVLHRFSVFTRDMYQGSSGIPLSK